MSVSPFTIVMIILIIVLLGIWAGLYFLGKKLEKRRDEQQEQIANTSQRVSMLIIDKKRMKMSESGLPESIIKQTPWYAKRSKIPIVKAKIGPQIMNMICAEEIFDQVPVKREVKATISGLYIVSVRGLHGRRESEEPVKKGFRAKLIDKMNQMRGS